MMEKNEFDEESMRRLFASSIARPSVPADAWQRQQVRLRRKQHRRSGAVAALAGVAALGAASSGLLLNTADGQMPAAIQPAAAPAVSVTAVDPSQRRSLVQGCIERELGGPARTDGPPISDRWIVDSAARLPDTTMTIFGNGPTPYATPIQQKMGPQYFIVAHEEGTDRYVACVVSSGDGRTGGAGEGLFARTPFGNRGLPSDVFHGGELGAENLLLTYGLVSERVRSVTVSIDDGAPPVAATVSGGVYVAVLRGNWNATKSRGARVVAHGHDAAGAVIASDDSTSPALDKSTCWRTKAGLPASQLVPSEASSSRPVPARSLNDCATVVDWAHR